MSDIFLSYAIEDQNKAAKLASIFKQQPWTVWMERHPPVFGMFTASFTARMLKDAKVIIALWSYAASVSATVPENLKQLTPALPVFVLLEKVEPPPEFMVVRAFDLSDWDGTTWNVGLNNLMLHLHTLIATSSPPAEPDIFSCGVPEVGLGNELRLPKRGADSRPEDDTRFKGVFISYRRDEAAAYARGLYDRLAARFGKARVFFDRENVGMGEDFVEVITSAAESCAVMIALISRQWSRGAGAQAELDDYVQLEVVKALKRGVRVIPILIQGAEMPAAKELPGDLAPLVRRNAHHLTDARWERDVEDLIKTLENLLKA